MSQNQEEWDSSQVKCAVCGNLVDEVHTEADECVDCAHKRFVEAHNEYETTKIIDNRQRDCDGNLVLDDDYDIDDYPLDEWDDYEYDEFRDIVDDPAGVAP